jgi:hypothetical protein
MNTPKNRQPILKSQHAKILPYKHNTETPPKRKTSRQNYKGKLPLTPTIIQKKTSSLSKNTILPSTKNDHPSQKNDHPSQKNDHPFQKTRSSPSKNTILPLKKPPTNFTSNG